MAAAAAVAVVMMCCWLYVGVSAGVLRVTMSWTAMVSRVNL